MVVRELIEKLSKVENLDKEIFISINESDGIKIEDITNERNAVFLEITLTLRELKLINWN